MPNEEDSELSEDSQFNGDHIISETQALEYDDLHFSPVPHSTLPRTSFAAVPAALSTEAQPTPYGMPLHCPSFSEAPSLSLLRCSTAPTCQRMHNKCMMDRKTMGTMSSLVGDSI